MAYTDVDAKYDVEIGELIGHALRGSPTTPAPMVSARIGGALFRALHEFAAVGITLDQFVEGLPSIALPAIAESGTRVGIPPAATASHISAGADYTAIADDIDEKWVEVVVIDVSFSVAFPTIAAPRLKEWCEALGGTYSDEKMGL